MYEYRPMELYFSCAWLHHGSLDRSIGAIVYFDIKLIFDLCAEMRAALSRPPTPQAAMPQHAHSPAPPFLSPHRGVPPLRRSSASAPGTALASDFTSPLKGQQLRHRTQLPSPANSVMSLARKRALDIQQAARAVLNGKVPKRAHSPSPRPSASAAGLIPCYVTGGGASSPSAAKVLGAMESKASPASSPGAATAPASASSS